MSFDVRVPPDLEMPSRDGKYKFKSAGVTYRLIVDHAEWAVRFRLRWNLPVVLGGGGLLLNCPSLYKIQVNGVIWNRALSRWGREWVPERSRYLPRHLPKEIMRLVNTTLENLVQPLQEIREIEEISFEQERQSQAAESDRHRQKKLARLQVLLAKVR